VLMDNHLFLLSWAPVLLLAVLAIFFRCSALALSVYGCLFTLLLVTTAFRTPWLAALLSAVDGALTMLPLLLVIFAGILLSSLLMKTGSLTRIVAWFMSGVRTAFQRDLLITLGVGNFMEGASVIAEPVVAPMLHAAGVSPVGSAALSIIGYAGLLALEMGGVIITILALVTGLPAEDLGIASAWLSIPAIIAMAACVPMYLDSANGFRPYMAALACGLFLGVAGLVFTVYIGFSVAGMSAGLALIIALILLGNRRLSTSRGVFIDLAPFIFMIFMLLLINTVPWLYELTARRLVLNLRIIPIHTITLQPFFSAYLYLGAAFCLSALLLKVPRSNLQAVLTSGFQKGWRASAAMGLFGAMGQMIAYSGYSDHFSVLDPLHNMPWVLSHGLKTYTGDLYLLFVPFLGWVGTFLTGYGTASLMLFGQLQVQAAELLNVSAVWLSAGLAVGAAIGSISSPFKIAIAAPMCEAWGKEGQILRYTIPIGVLSSFVIGLAMLIFT
jgi:lactate permease